LLVLGELELWPNLVKAANEHGAKVAIVNGRLSARSFRGYQRIGWLTRRMLDSVDLFAAQNEEYAHRFRSLGARRDCVHVTGSLKFDGAQTDRNNERTLRLRQLASFTDDDIVFLAGSTQAPEEELAINTFKSLADEHPRLKLVLVPRHPHRFDEVSDILERAGLPWRRRSQVVQDSTPNSELRTPNSPILLVDTVGELSAWWGTATMGFVGGSLGSRGGQNMIEPAAYGVATCFGPNTQNFRDVVQILLADDAALVIRNGEELTDFVRRCLEEPIFARRLGERAQVLIGNHRGATLQTLALITRLAATPAKGLLDAA
jgi:3-deoxy-D-manno-octulosonic-acid transferase